MSRILPALLMMVPALAIAQVTTGPSITGTTSPVNTGAGDQTDPHVSGDWVAYTSELNGTSEIRYHNLAQSTDSAIPSNGGLDFLSDIDGSTLVYTHVGNSSAIYLFDVSTGGTPVELDPQPGSNRREGRIGGNTVVWQDFSFTGDLSQPELVVYDLTAQTATRLTTDTLLDKDPAVSPDGNTVVWTKCQTDGTGCHIFQATKSATGWTTVQLTSGAEEAGFPDTNGQIVVYSSVRTQPDGTSDEDVYWQPVGGGAEQRLALPDRQTNPNVSGNLIAFEGFDSTAAVPNFDIYVFDLATQTLYRLTDTAEDETLNDISVSNGTGHVVWTRSGADFDVYAFTFTIPGSVDCSAQAATTCEKPGSRPLLASLEADRQRGVPFWSYARFDSEPGDGLLCIQNGSTGTPATAGAVAVNGENIVEAWAFKKATTTIDAHIQLAAHDEVGAVIAGAPGSGYHVNVYGPVPACAASAAASSASLAANDLVPGGVPLVSPGRRLLAIDGSFAVPPSAAATPVTGGCSSTGTDASAAGLIALLALIALSSRKPAPVRVRASRSRRRR